MDIRNAPYYYLARVAGKAYIEPPLAPVTEPYQLSS